MPQEQEISNISERYVKNVSVPKYIILQND